jgi:RHS repeat-associated protein
LLNAYTYGFNGKENEIEAPGWQDYGLREYDTRICRFISVDPLTSDYPWYTPYQFAGNKPIEYIDLDGGEEQKTDDKKNAESVGADINAPQSIPSTKSCVTCTTAPNKVDANPAGNDNLNVPVQAPKTAEQTPVPAKTYVGQGITNETVLQLTLNFTNCTLGNPSFINYIPVIGNARMAGRAAAYGYYSEAASYLAFSLAEGYTLRPLSTPIKGGVFAEKLFENETFGVTSVLFANQATGYRGLLNKPGLIKMGWSSTDQNGGGMLLRIGIGTAKQNANVAKYHISIPFTLVSDSYKNPILNLKRSIFGAGKRPIDFIKFQ